MIRAIIFDFGNVIYKFDNSLFLDQISDYSDKSVSELNEIFYQNLELAKQYETGCITSDQFFTKAVELGRLHISKSDFIRAFTNIFTPVQETFDLIRRLKSRYKIGLLSNTNEWDFEYAIKKCEIYECFNAVSLSFMVREMKPGKKIYLDVLNKLNLPAEECIYIDDIKDYAEAAAQLGIVGIHYTSHEQLVDSLKQLHVSLS